MYSHRNTSGSNLNREDKKRKAVVEESWQRSNNVSVYHPHTGWQSHHDYEDRSEEALAQWFQRCSTGPSQSESYLNILSEVQGILASFQVNQEMMPYGILTTIFEIVAKSATDATIHFHAMSTLKEAFDLVGELLSYDFTIEEVLSSMISFRDSVPVQIEGSKFLQRVFDLIDGEFPHLEDTRSVLFGAMNYHTENSALQSIALDLLRRLKPPASARKEWVGGTRVIMKSLKRHPTNVNIQQLGLSMLAWLAEEDGCRRVVVDEDGIDSVPDIMRLHPDDALIQCNGAAILSWLIHAGSNSGRLDLDPRHVSTILTAIALHNDDPSAFGNCVCVLCGLAEIPDEPEVLKVVVEGMNKHVSSPKVQEGCLRWIRFRDPTTCEEELLDSIPSILAAMRRHPTDAHLQAQACDVLAVLSDVPSLRECFLEAGAVDMVLHTLQLHRDNVRIQQAVMWFFTLITPLHPASVAFGGGLGAIEMIWKGLGIKASGAE